MELQVTLSRLISFKLCNSMNSPSRKLVGQTIIREVQSRGQSTNIDPFVNVQYPHTSTLSQLPSMLTEMFPSVHATLLPIL